MQENEYLHIIQRLNTLEKHLVNQISPIQELTKLLSTTNILDDFMRRLLSVLHHYEAMIKQSASTVTDIARALDQKGLGELKYIASRLKTIEEDIQEIKDPERKVRLDISLDGYEMVKKPVSYDKSEQLAAKTISTNDEILARIEKLLEHDKRLYVILVNRLSLCKDAVYTYKDIGKKVALSGSMVAKYYNRALRYVKRDKQLMQDIKKSKLKDLYDALK